MSKRRTSKNLRQDPKLLRNDFSTIGQYGLPIIKKCEINLEKIQLIGVDKIKKSERGLNLYKTVHFFVDDIKMDRYFNNYENYLPKLAQYINVLTPDYSLYPEMPIAVQIFNTFKNRWCGAYWQEFGLSVIPTISWSTEISYAFCFDGIEQESVVAISTLGCLKEKELFLNGYFEMKKRINPKQILCLGKAFSEMGDEVISVDYLKTSRR